MLPYLVEHFGNPSSSNVYGKRTRAAVEKARGQVAALIGAETEEIVFTAGGSESDNHAIIGAALASQRGKHIVTSRIEHPAVINTCRYLEERLSFSVTYLPVDEYGSLSPKSVLDAITEDTVLISVMHANNEVGTIEPVEEIGRIARDRGILLHTDAAQSCGKVAVDVNELSVDLLTIAGHKLYAPKGIGALYIRSGTRIDPIIHGSKQESGRRAGTENVAFIVALGAACQLARQTLYDYERRTGRLRDRLQNSIEQSLGKEMVQLNGHPRRRLPNTLNISIQGLVGEELLAQLPEVAASAGAACHAGSKEPSGVLLELGLSRELALGALRLSLGRWSTKGDIDRAGKLIVGQARRLAKTS
jgi:cysteine desulfurase